MNKKQPEWEADEGEGEGEGPDPAAEEKGAEAAEEEYGQWGVARVGAAPRTRGLAEQLVSENAQDQAPRLGMLCKPANHRKSRRCTTNTCHF